MNKCRPRGRQTKRLNLAIDARVFDRFEPTLRSEWGGSISSWVEYAMECWLRDSCVGCPYAEEDGLQKVGIGHIASKD